MNFLISMNSKFFSKYDSEKLIDVIINLDVNKFVRGAEIYIDMTNESEKEYCLKLVKVMKDNNWIIQIHSTNMHNLKEDIIQQYLEYYNKLALLYNEKIKITIHPAEENSVEKSTMETIKVLTYVNEYVVKNNFNLEILLENLNALNNIKRCNIYQVYEIIDNVEISGITLDMGHYVYDYSNDYTNLDSKYINKIKNIHIHDIDNNKVDHYPFYYGNVKIEEIFVYLNQINYKENIVLEYGLEYLNGETFENKLDEYINQIKCINNYWI